MTFAAIILHIGNLTKGRKMKDCFSLAANPLLVNPLLPETQEAELQMIPFTDTDRRAVDFYKRAQATI